MAAGQFRAIARAKLSFGMSDNIRVVETPTGYEIEDDDVFVHLDPDIPLTVMNLTRDQAWTHPLVLLWLLRLSSLLNQFFQFSIKPPHHQFQVTGGDASNLYPKSIHVYNVRAQQVELGDRHHTVRDVRLPFLLQVLPADTAGTVENSCWLQPPSGGVKTGLLPNDDNIPDEV